MGSPIGADLGCCRRNDQPGPLSPGSAASTDRLNAATRAGAEAIVGLMRDKLLAAMRDRGGFITRSDALLLVDRHIVGQGVALRCDLQHVVHTAAGRFVLDRAYLEEMVGVELDGAAWHGSAAQRERDVRRDAALAAAGWLIVRFTHARLSRESLTCRRELAAILAVRRQQRRIA
jgi:very-short-patch-repair endonuclease